MMCRSGAVGILNQFKNAPQYQNKIILLSDDKNMAIYYRQNPEIYQYYRKIYNKKLSDILSQGYLSTACLATASGIKCYLLGKIEKDTLTYFYQTIYLSDQRKGNSKSIIDSVISKETPVLSFDGQKAILFNKQFQFGMTHNLPNGGLTYDEPNFDDTTVLGIYNLFRSYVTDTLTNIIEAKNAFKATGLPQIAIKNLDNEIGRSAFFQLNTVITEPKINDTHYHYVIRGRLFLALKSKKTDHPLDLRSYESYIWLDSLHIDGKIYQPETIFNYEIYKNHYYFSYYEIDDTMNSRIKPVHERIIEFTKGNDNKPKVINIYDLKDYGKYNYNYFFRIDTRGTPVVVNEQKKSIHYFYDNSDIDFSELLINTGDSITRIFDILPKEDTLYYIASVNNKYFVKGQYFLKEKKCVAIPLNENTTYDGAKINDKKIYAFKKDIEQNLFEYEIFTF